MDVSVRPFKPDDFDTLWRIDRECFPPQIAYSRAELEHYVNRRASFAFVAENGDRDIVGFIVAEASRMRRAGHIITLDVRAHARRIGVASRLMTTAEREVQQRGCDLVFLETAVNNAPAIAFYERNDYRILKTIPRYYNGEIDAFLMGKKLTVAAAKGTSGPASSDAGTP